MDKRPILEKMKLPRAIDSPFLSQHGAYSCILTSFLPVLDTCIPEKLIKKWLVLGDISIVKPFSSFEYTTTELIVKSTDQGTRRYLLTPVTLRNSELTGSVSNQRQDTDNTVTSKNNLRLTHGNLFILKGTIRIRVINSNIYKLYFKLDLQYM